MLSNILNQVFSDKFNAFINELIKSWCQVAEKKVVLHLRIIVT